MKDALLSFKENYKYNREEKSKTYNTKVNRLKLSQVIFKTKL
jgi:hypothetical protein